MVEIILPKWGLTMEVGVLREWRKHQGDRVEAGEVVAEVETEKITNELEAPAGGVICKILVPAGDAEVKVGSVLCLIDED